MGRLYIGKMQICTGYDIIKTHCSEHGLRECKDRTYIVIFTRLSQVMTVKLDITQHHSELPGTDNSKIFLPFAGRTTEK